MFDTVLVQSLLRCPAEVVAADCCYSAGLLQSLQLLQLDPPVARMPELRFHDLRSGPLVPAGLIPADAKQGLAPSAHLERSA